MIEDVTIAVYPGKDTVLDGKKPKRILPMMKKRYWYALAALTAVVLGWMSIRPSGTRDWVPDQATLAEALMDGDAVTIKNVRNSLYRSTTDFDLTYEDRTYDLNQIDSLWYVVEPLSKDSPSVAHTFLTFGFKDGKHVGISVEVRKEKGEKFSPLWGLFKQFELIYVVGDEKDLIKLRSNHRKNDVYLYPIQMEPKEIRSVFTAMLTRANTLRDNPEFYNTLTNNCTTNVRDALNTAVPGSVPYGLGILLPGYSDALFYDAGLIETELSFADTKAHKRINERAMTHADDPDFSAKIREN